MTTTSARREQIVASLQDKEYRELFVAEEIDTGLPLQIRALRKARGWSQADLARRTGMTQEGVSRLERLDYGSYTLATLKRLAAALDVALVVRFEPFSGLVDWVANLSPEDMAVPDFEHDPGLVRGAGQVETMLTAEALPAVSADATGRHLRLLPSPPKRKLSSTRTATTWESPLSYHAAPATRTSYAAANMRGERYR